MTTKELVRHDWDLEDGWCHAHRAYCSMAEEAAPARPERCPVCGGLNPDDVSHTRCM